MFEKKISQAKEFSQAENRKKTHRITLPYSCTVHISVAKNHRQETIQLLSEKKQRYFVRLVSIDVVDL